MAPVRPVTVAPTVEDGILVLTLTYEPSVLNALNGGQQIGEELKTQYDAQQGTPAVKMSSCVIDVRPPRTAGVKGGSPLVRALFMLWQHVVQLKGGQVIVVGFPADSRYALDALGLPTMPGYVEADSVKKALERLGKAEGRS